MSREISSSKHKRNLRLYLLRVSNNFDDDFFQLFYTDFSLQLSTLTDRLVSYLNWTDRLLCPANGEDLDGRI